MAAEKLKKTYNCELCSKHMANRKAYTDHKVSVIQCSGSNGV